MNVRHATYKASVSVLGFKSLLHILPSDPVLGVGLLCNLIIQ
jgi:hypothetical protein